MLDKVNCRELNYKPRTNKKTNNNRFTLVINKY